MPSNIINALFPFKYPTILATLYLGGMLNNNTYIAIKDRTSDINEYDVIVKTQDMSKINHVLIKMNYGTVSPTDVTNETDSKKTINRAITPKSKKANQGKTKA